MKVVIYDTEFCILCPIVKKFLSNNGVSFKIMHMDTPLGQTELAVNGVFTLSAPVLQIDDKFLLSGDLFPNGGLNETRLRKELGI